MKKKKKKKRSSAPAGGRYCIYSTLLVLIFTDFLQGDKVDFICREIKKKKE